MTNRPSTLRHRRKERVQKSNRRAQVLAAIAAIVVIAVVAVVILINTGKTPASAGDIVTVPTQTWPQANGKNLGPADAKVVLSEYADFQCPYCKHFHDTVFPQIVTQLVATGKVRFESHDFIIIDANVGGTESRKAAEAAECANEQGKYWDYFNILYANQQTEASGTFSDLRLKAFAASIGLDTAKFNSCFTTGKYAEQVSADDTRARNLGLNSTPTLLVNGKPVTNVLDFASIQTAVDAASK